MYEVIAIILAIWILPILLIKIFNRISKSFTDKEIITDDSDLIFIFWPLLNWVGVVIYFIITMINISLHIKAPKIWDEFKEILFKIAR